MAITTAKGPDRGSKLTLAFGLVNIPVRYKPLAEASSPISAKLNCPDHFGVKLTQGYTCSVGTADEHPIDRADIVKGYPHPDTKEMVQVDPAVIEEFAEARTGNAAIEKIVDASTIDPGFFEKTLIVWPGDGGADAFDLFASALREEGKAAVTTTVISKQTKTVIFRWSEEFDCLLAHVCSFASQLRLGDVGLVRNGTAERVPPPKAQITAAKALLATLEGEFDPAEVDDEYTPAVQDAIRQIAKSGKIAAPKAGKPVAKADDLMASLMASIDVSKKAPAKKKAAPRKKVTA